jgi:putative spermidine/putrescine transport system ATP-binding protein
VAGLEVRDLTRRYSDAVVVGPVSFTAAEGEFVSLLGPSGCGKTTTLRCIAGFESADAGDIRVDGRSLIGLPPHRRDVGLVFQNYALFPHLTVFENVAFGLRLRRRPAAEIAGRVAEALRLVDLVGLDGRHPSQLSGGQQQRVALARCLALEPRLLLLDEPLSNLDLKLRLQMRTEIRKLQRRLGKTAIYVTHDQGEALALSDRIVVMSRGRVEQIGTPREIYETPRTRFVADFIGASNLLAGQVAVASGESATVRVGGVSLASSHGGGIATGQAVTVLVRPERVRLAPPSNDRPGPNVLAGRAADVVYLGEDLQITVETEGGLTLAVNLKASDTDKELAPGAAVTVWIAPGDVRLLPAEAATA